MNTVDDPHPTLHPPRKTPTFIGGVSLPPWSTNPPPRFFRSPLSPSTRSSTVSPKSPFASASTSQKARNSSSPPPSRPSPSFAASPNTALQSRCPPRHHLLRRRPCHHRPLQVRQRCQLRLRSNLAPRGHRQGLQIERCPHRHHRRESQPPRRSGPPPGSPGPTSPTLAPPNPPWNPSPATRSTGPSSPAPPPSGRSSSFPTMPSILQSKSSGRPSSPPRASLARTPSPTGVPTPPFSSPRVDRLNQKRFPFPALPGSRYRSHRRPRGRPSLGRRREALPATASSATPTSPPKSASRLLIKTASTASLAPPKPLSHQGTLIENICCRFVDGKIVEASASAGEEALNRLISTDDGARCLGEVALVPHSSPIAQTGILFWNTLFARERRQPTSPSDRPMLPASSKARPWTSPP